jgi:hypothetical protein
MRAGVELGRIDSLPPEATLEDRRHIMADAVVAAGALHDEDGALLMPRGLMLVDVEVEPNEGGDPPVYAVVNEGGGAEDRRVLAVDFREGYQASPDDLHPYRTVNGHIIARNDNGPEGLRSVIGDGSDLPPATRARWRSVTPPGAGSEPAGEHGERRGTYPAGFDQQLTRRIQMETGSTASPTTRQEQRDMLRTIPSPELRQRLIDETVHDLGTNVLEHEGRTPTETIEEFPEVLDDIEAVAWWNPEFRTQLMIEFLILTDSLPGVVTALGYTVDGTGRPVIRDARGQRVNPLRAIHRFRDEIPHPADVSVTVEQVDNAINRAYQLTWNNIDARLADEAPASPAGTSEPAAADDEPEEGSLPGGDSPIEPKNPRWREVGRGLRGRVTDPEGAVQRSRRLAGNALRYGTLTSAEAPTPVTEKSVEEKLDDMLRLAKSLKTPRNPRGKKSR